MGDKIRLPSSEGGLVRYFEDEQHSKIMLKPEHVIAITVIVAVAGVVLTIYGSKLLGAA